MVNINEVREGQVALDIECLDRIYLNGYVPILQIGGQVIRFIKELSGKNISSPAILEKIRTSFRQSGGSSSTATTKRAEV